MIIGQLLPKSKNAQRKQGCQEENLRGHVSCWKAKVLRATIEKQKFLNNIVLPERKNICKNLALNNIVH